MGLIRLIFSEHGIHDFMDDSELHEVLTMDEAYKLAQQKQPLSWYFEKPLTIADKVQAFLDENLVDIINNELFFSDDSSLILENPNL
jgi:hypothetical protein